MAHHLRPKVLVIGGGPGGYVAAIRAGQLGLDTVLVEADRLGGTCLTRGCISSKALIHVAGIYAQMSAAASQGSFGVHLDAPPRLEFLEMMRWKDGIVDRLNNRVAAMLERARVRVVRGWGRFVDGNTCRVEGEQEFQTIQADHVILATGSRPAELPSLPFGGPVISSTEALSLGGVPRRLVVVGAGYIGLELGMTYAKFGSKVTIVETGKQILPQYDSHLVEPVRRKIDSHGIRLYLGAKVVQMREEGLEIIDGHGETLLLPANKVLVTIGRKPNTTGWGIEELRVKMLGSFVEVDARCATSAPNIWAIGDLVGEPMLAQKASAQGEMVAEIISGRRRQFDPIAIPDVYHTDPEIVSVGLNPADIPAGVEVLTAQFPFEANARAMTLGIDGGGFVRVIARKDDHRILTLQAVGPQISELSGQMATLIEMGALLEDVAGILQGYPTLSEAIHEVSLEALGRTTFI